MNSIKQKRGQAKGCITRTHVFALTIDSSTTLAMSEIRLVKLEEAWKEFVSLLNELYGHVEDPEYAELEAEFVEYESKYFLAQSTIVDHIRKLKSSEQHNDSDRIANLQASLLQTINSTSTSGSINLPKLSIPTFSGDYKDWPAFRDLFTGSVDCNTSLNSTQKFHYLKSFLRGEAANLIKHMVSTESNYIEAWDRLEKRFDRGHLIVQAFIQSYISLPTSTSVNTQLLRKITDGADEAIRGLNALGSNSRDPWLIYLLLLKVDQETKQAWAEQVGTRENSTIDELLEFLHTRCDCLESCSSLSRHTQIRNRSQVSIRTHFVEQGQCPKCNEDHILPRCNAFNALDIESRRNFVKELSLCFNCLRQGHLSNNCRSSYRCRTCKAKHHSLVHPNQNFGHPENNSGRENSNTLIDLSSTHVSPQTSFMVNHSLDSTHHIRSVLPTATARILDNHGSYQIVRLLLDTGSQVSLITERTVQRLGLARKPSRIPVMGVASTSAGTTNGLVSAHLSSCYNSDFIEVSCYVLPRLTSLLPASSLQSISNNLLSCALADPHFSEPGPIDILIGADKVFNVITGPVRKGINGGPVMLPTIFGWVITGNPSRVLDNNIASFCTQLDFNQEYDLEKFWRQEEVHVEPVLSVAEEKAEDHFSSTHSRNPDGRYVVQLPFKYTSTVDYGNSLDIATRRFFAMERKFMSNQQLQLQYTDFINEYLSLGHMEQIPSEEIIQPSTKSFYLPHHAVFKADSSTSKIRVVFDGSAKAANSLSLNESLLIGPTIQRDMFSICLRFRRHLYTLSADIEKMYRQIQVAHKDANFQRIVWRENNKTPLKHFRLLTVTYGTSCAPFLAVRTLKQLALDSVETHPLASQILLNDFYVDDLITGADTIDEITVLRSELISLLKSGGFNLRKWTTNCWPLLLSLPLDEREPSPIDFEQSSSIKLLGMQWCPYKDSFSYKVRLNDLIVYSKRRILSESSRIFDPMGFLAPIIVGIKIIFQDLWREKLKWDDQIPQEIAERWKLIRQELPLLETISIPRILWTNKTHIELHAFCDASLDAYASVVYCRSTNSNDSTYVSLVAAKTKVAPLKVLSLPRLELCGAVLLIRLINKLKMSLQDKEIKVYAWTDSSIVLHWLTASPKRWSVFIANRTSEILSSIPRHGWNHVRSEDNPADVATRGILPSLLQLSNIWWKGPSWLSMDKCQWPVSDPCTKEIPVHELEERSISKPQILLQGFWKRWHQEYLTSLQQRAKWQTSQSDIKLDDIVLLKEPNLPPSKWILGRIVKLHTGKDNKTRVVTVRTKYNDYIRPIVKIAPLPISESP